MTTLLLALSLALNGILYFIFRWERQDKDFWFNRAKSQARHAHNWFGKYIEALKPR